MTDFGRNDFGSVLKRLFGEADADVIKDFNPSKKAQVDDEGSLDTMESSLGTMLTDFEKKWDTMKDILRSTVQNALTEMKKYSDANPRAVRDDNPTSDEEAQRNVLGMTKSQLADRNRRKASAPEEGKTSNGADPKLMRLSSDNWTNGVSPETRLTPKGQEDLDSYNLGPGLRDNQLEKARLARLVKTT